MMKPYLFIFLFLCTAAVARIHGGIPNGSSPPFGPGSPGFLSTCSSKFAGAPSTPVNCPAGVAFRDFSPLTYAAGNPIVPQNTASYNAGGVNLLFAVTTFSSGNYYGLANCTTLAGRNNWQHQCLYDGPDVTHWTLLSDAYQSSSGQWDDNYLLHPAIAPSGTCSLATWCAYYSARNPATTTWKIGVATSSNLTSWTKYASNPLTFSGCGVSNPGLPSIIQIGSTLYMYIVTNGNAGNSIVYFTSAVGDGVTWTCGGTALPAPLSTDWDFTGLFAEIDPYVFKNSHSFYEMVYTAYGSFGQELGYAVSADGINWWKYQAAPIITNNSTAYPGTYDIGDAVFYQDGTNFSVVFGYDDGIGTAASAISQMTDH